MRQLLAALVVVLGLTPAALGAVPASALPANDAAPLAALKPCKSGWAHGVINRQHKCLRAGQFCTKTLDRQYHRFGFHCHKRDKSGRYRLTR